MTKDSMSPELLALLNADLEDLAARLLVAAFTPLLDRPYPALARVELAEELGRLGGVKVPNFAWSFKSQPGAGLARLTIELVLMWEEVGLAARGLRDEGEVVLLFAGETVLRDDDPEEAAREALAGTA
ncbi:hypothetical protein E1212_22800 [Jiangella ureilytica]|uniref:Uncharacterized protein n=1 Tax=Jiangella ureilytica TaxID=2530374 RepID=A0A4R4RF06_9ACTN|nr:hypothetical protein [Jiangella ureilytica]TDC47938.1 hypothetical protein E1212_22800 [Jiangella ureilytica]